MDGSGDGEQLPQQAGTAPRAVLGRRGKNDSPVEPASASPADRSRPTVHGDALHAPASRRGRVAEGGMLYDNAAVDAATGWRGTSHGQ